MYFRKNKNETPQRDGIQEVRNLVCVRMFLLWYLVQISSPLGYLNVGPVIGFHNHEGGVIYDVSRQARAPPTARLDVSLPDIS